MTPSSARPKVAASPVPFFVEALETTIELGPTATILVFAGIASGVISTLIPGRSPLVSENPEMVVLPAAIASPLYLLVAEFQIPWADQNGPRVPWSIL